MSTETFGSRLHAPEPASQAFQTDIELLPAKSCGPPHRWPKGDEAQLPRLQASAASQCLRLRRPGPTPCVRTHTHGSLGNKVIKTHGTAHLENTESWAPQARRAFPDLCLGRRARLVLLLHELVLIMHVTSAGSSSLKKDIRQKAMPCDALRRTVVVQSPLQVQLLGRDVVHAVAWASRGSSYLISIGAFEGQPG